MKGWLLGGALAAAGVGYGVAGGDDVNRTVRLPVAKVYQGFDKLMTPNGSTIVDVPASQSPDGEAGTMEAHFERVENKSLQVKVDFRDHTFMTFRLDFKPAGENVTKLAANLDLDPGVMSKRGDGVGAPPAFIVSQVADLAATKIVDKVIGDLYAGRDPRSQPATFWLPKKSEYSEMSDEARAFQESTPDTVSRREEQYRVESRMREAGRPMVDPNAVAKRNSGDW